MKIIHASCYLYDSLFISARHAIEYQNKYFLKKENLIIIIEQMKVEHQLE
jgi:hypothetical protein